MEQTNLFNQVVSKETIDSFGLETQNWTEENMMKLHESMTLAFKENWDEWMEDPELAYEECRYQVQDVLLEQRLDRMEEWLWENDDTRERDAVIDRLLWEVGEGAKRIWEFFNNASPEETAPETPLQLTTVEPTLPPPPPVLRHTPNVDGNYGMYVNTDACTCIGCREHREQQNTPTELEEIVDQYRW
jgi:hypothetical protein